MSELIASLRALEGKRRSTRAPALLALLLTLVPAPTFASGPKPFVARGHYGRVVHLAFSPDGALLASTGGDKSVRVWEASSGLELRSLTREGDVRFSWVGFTADGKQLFAGQTASTSAFDVETGEDVSTYIPGDHDPRGYGWVGPRRLAIRRYKTLHLYDLDSRKVVFEQPVEYASAIVGTPDGRWIAVLSSNGSALHDAASGAKLRPLPAARGGLALRDASRMALWTKDGLAIVRLETGAIERTIPGVGSPIGVLASGEVLAVEDPRSGSLSPGSPAQKGKPTRVLGIDPASGTAKPLLQLPAGTDSGPWALDASGSHLAAGTESGEVLLFDVHTGTQLWRRADETATIRSARFLAGGGIFVGASRGGHVSAYTFGRGGGTARGLDLPSAGQQEILSVLPSPDGGRLAVLHDRGTTRSLSLLDRNTGKVSASQKLDAWPLAFDPTGGLLAAAVTESRTNRAWLELLDGKKLTKVRRTAVAPGTWALSTAVFTGDGARIVAGAQGSAYTFDAKSGKVLAAMDGDLPGTRATSVTLSPDEQRAAIGGNLNITIWPVAGGAHSSFRAADGTAEATAWSPDGRHLMVGTWRHDIQVYETTRWAKEGELLGHDEEVRTLVFDPTGRWLLSTSADRTLRLWDFPARRLAATLYVLARDEWIVLAPDGRFDGSPGAFAMLHYVAGRTPIPLSSYYERDFTPRLLEQLLGAESAGAGAPEPRAKPLSVPPRVRFASEIPAEVEGAELDVIIEAEDQGGGVGELRLYHDGKLVAEHERGVQRAAERLRRRTVKLLLSPGTNRLRATALSSDGVEAVGAEAAITRRAAVQKGKLFIVAVGIDDYENPKYRLSYAKSDAAAFGDAVAQRASGIFAEIKRFDLLDRSATRGALERTFAELASLAAPEDTLVTFYAGHGVMGAEDTGASDFYLVPFDVTNLYGNPADLEAKGLSAKRLRELAAAIRAKKQLFVIDACEAGGAVEAFAVRGAAEERAMAQLARSAGVVVLAATGTTQLANEVSALGHGVFTHAILAALSGAADGAPKDGQVTVKELEAYVGAQVPELTEKHRGSRQYPTSFSRGQDFPLGISR